MGNYFSTNLKYLRKKTSKTQSDIALEVNKTNTAISNWEKEITEPGLQEIIEISRFFGISIDDLLNVDLTTYKGIQKLETSKNDEKYKVKYKPTYKVNADFEQKEAKQMAVNEASEQYHFGVPKVVVANASGRENIVHVPIKARAGYLTGYGDTEFIESLPSYSLPGLRNGTFRSFEVSGHSMRPTMLNHDYVVGEWCEGVENIREGRIHIIVTHSDGIVIKRVLNRISERNKLYLKSDNITNRADYPTTELDPSDIKEIWYARMRFTPDFSEPGEVYSRLNDLEIAMFELQKHLKTGQ